LSPYRALKITAPILILGFASLAHAEGVAEEQTLASVAGSKAQDQDQAASGEVEAQATPVIDKLHASLLSIMKSAEELGYQGRYDEVEPIVLETFDLKFMAAKSVGRTWKKLPEEDQARWLDVFRSIIKSNYADRFNGYSGESFETLGEEPAIRDTRVVRTQLLRPGEEAVQLNYRLRQVDGEWRIIDIYLNGNVSELALRRSEYSAVLKRDGFEKLLSTLQDKVDSLSKS
jgi:phospholipid transport system substrate-binding protein